MATWDGLEVVEVQFDNSIPYLDRLPQLDIPSNNNVILNEVSGEGHIRIRVDPSAEGGGGQILPVITADIEAVLAEPNAIFEYNATNEDIDGSAPPQD